MDTCQFIGEHSEFIVRKLAFECAAVIRQGRNKGRQVSVLAKKDGFHYACSVLFADAYHKAAELRWRDIRC